MAVAILSRRVIAMAIAMLATGCNATTTVPSLGQPGTAEIQRARATFYDPFPETDVGPEAVGTRPRDYAIPLPEAERARWAPPPSTRRGTPLVPMPNVPGPFMPPPGASIMQSPRY